MGVSVIQNFFLSAEIGSKKFFSDHYFIDDSMLLMRISSLRAELGAITSPSSSITPQTRTGLDNWLERKKTELSEFYGHGGEVVVIVDDNPVMTYFYTTGSKYEVDIISLLNIELFNIVYTPILGTDFNCNSLLQELFNGRNVKFHYSFSNETKEIKALANTIRSKNIVSFSAEIKRGKLLAIPNLQFNINSSQLSSTKEYFIDQVTKILKTDYNNLSDLTVDAPQWVEEFIFSNQQVQQCKLEPLIEKRNEIDGEIIKKKELIKRYNILKSVLYAKGKPLEIAVCKCFEHLNIEYKVPEGSDTDLTIQNGNLFFAIEIKGASGSATKQHTRQLEEWTISCANSNDLEDVKGLLIINAFCETPIAERNSIVFPPNVIEYSKARQHCLMTTTTLLELIKTYDDKMLKGQAILQLINQTSGILDYKHVPKQK